MAWLWLLLAGLSEIIWAVGLKYSLGFTRLWPSVITVLGMVVSFYFLSLALKYLPIGTAYAIWTGIGAVGTVMYGIIVFHEPTSVLRLICIFLIIAAMIGLKLTASH